MTVLKFPYSASRRIHSRQQRRSKYGTPEERAAKAAAAAIVSTKDGAVINLSTRNAPPSRPRRMTISGDLLDKLASALEPDRRQALLADVSRIMRRYCWGKD
jgi:hypothetical protein